MKWFFLLFLFSCAHKQNSNPSDGSVKQLHTKEADSITLFHYNIKELSTEKIESPQSEQISAVAKTLQQFIDRHGPIDILSLNEVQFDLKNIPNKNYSSLGQNLNKLAERFEIPFAHSIFSQANTGKLAKKNLQGNYLPHFEAKHARQMADQVNFGLFPGQYSTGALTNLKVISVTVIDKLLWKEFNPTLDLSKFRLANAKKIPEDIQLFDKNFTDVVLETKDKVRFHLILLHTVPAYHFGNKKSVNYLRNADQLRFLEWYLTGKTDFGVPKIIDDGNRISPLPADARFVAVGDWNTDPSNLDNPGSWVLKRLFKTAKPWLAPEQMSFTNENPGFKERPFRLMLDYILVDKKTSVIQGEILHPNFSFNKAICQEQALGPQEIPQTLKSQGSPEMHLVRFKKWDPKTKKSLHCYTHAHKSYIQYKQASDHYPIFLEFKL